MIAGETVDEEQVPPPQRPPEDIAELIAAVSSVTPLPVAPKSLTLRKTWYELGFGLNAEVP